MTTRSKNEAGVAQLVERNLAKVEVESSRLFSRSSLQCEDVNDVTETITRNYLMFLA
jgi:hypothetical protein